MIVSMNGVDFLTTLEDLKANRRISSEAKALFDPFRGQKVTLKFLYCSSIRTFANRFDSAYDGGYTITAKIEDRKIEVNLLLDQSKNQLVESLESGDPLEYQFTVLDFDEFYQRAILGQVAQKDAVERELEEAPRERQDKLFETDEPDEADEEPAVPLETEKPKEIPTKTESHEKGWQARPARARKEFDRKEIVKSPSGPAKRKIGSGGVLMGVVGMFAALGAAWGFENEYPFLGDHGFDSPEHWIFWAILTFPLAVGLPCLANRAWKSLLVTLLAFAIDLAGISLFFSEPDNASGNTEMNSTGPEEAGTSVAPTEAEAANKALAQTCYNTALLLHSLGILGLAKSLASMKFSFPAVLLGWLHLVYALMLIFNYEGLWRFLELFPIDSVYFFLLPILACCFSITLEGMKATEKKPVFR